MRCKLVVINCALYKLLRYASIFEDENLKAEIIVCPVVTYFYFISTNHFFFILPLIIWTVRIEARKSDDVLL